MKDVSHLLKDLNAHNMCKKIKFCVSKSIRALNSHLMWMKYHKCIAGD